MWLASGRSWVASAWLDAASTAAHGGQGIGQCRPCLSDAEQAPGEDGLECAECVGAIRAGAGLDGVVSAAAAEQCAQVVGQDLGGEVLLQGEVVQPRRGLEAQTMLDALEGLLDAPALVIERAELRGRIRLGIEQVGHQDADLAVRSDVADQAHGGGGAGQIERAGIACGGRRQCDHALGLVRASEVGDATPAAGIDAQTEGHAVLRQRRCHGVADVTSVEHEQILRRIECVERLEQHLPLRAVGRMQTGVQREFGARQKQGKRVVVRRQCGRLACRHTQARRISRHHAAAIPACRLYVRARQVQQVRTGQFEQPARKPLAGLAEGLCADLADPPGHRMQATEKGVEFGLNARAHARDHHGRQARQGELAIAGEGPRPKTYLLGQRGVEQKVSELGQQRLVVEYSSSYCLFINDLTNAILPVSHRVHKGYKLKLRALLTARQKGLDRFLGASLAFAEPAARLAYRNVLANGLNELEALLQGDGVL